MREIEIRFASDREYDRLRHIRDKYGVQWRGMLIQGARRLEARSHAGLSRSTHDDSVQPGSSQDGPKRDTTSTGADVDRRRFFESR